MTPLTTGRANPTAGSTRFLSEIAAQKPDFMLWLGDTYLREPDWNSEAGILYRYTHTRSLLQLPEAPTYLPTLCYLG